jgi:divinyl chlorophyllide a 8-vinyl-reductase
VTCFLRAQSDFELEGTHVLRGDIQALPSLEGFDVLVSCLASRTGAPKEARAIDHQAQAKAMRAFQAAGGTHVIALSAICVQRPKLAFQEAKLRFEEELMASGLTYSIVRPTAYFKSLTGQLDRLRAGKPYLIFGDGRLTSCKPISNRDLARFIASCIDDTSRQNAVLPIGGPGPALTPRDIGEMMFRLLDRPAKFRSVSPKLLQLIAGALSGLGLRNRAEFARIGHYYGTESMLLWTGDRYDAQATPETGSDRLEDYIAARVQGAQQDERGAHAVF